MPNPEWAIQKPDHVEVVFGDRTIPMRWALAADVIRVSHETPPIAAVVVGRFGRWIGTVVTDFGRADGQRSIGPMLTRRAAISFVEREFNSYGLTVRGTIKVAWRDAVRRRREDG